MATSCHDSFSLISQIFVSNYVGRQLCRSSESPVEFEEALQGQLAAVLTS